MYRFLADFLQPFLLLYLLTGLALANLWRKRTETRGRLLLVTLPFLGLIVICTPAVAYLALGSLEWRYPPQYDRPDDVEAIVVLGGAMWPPDELRLRAELGQDTLYRCLHAARLYRQGKPCLVVVSGGIVEPDTPGPTLAELMHDFLREQGVAEADLLVEDKSRSTYENAVGTRTLLRQRGIDKILLVTDATHLRRAQRCFRAQGFEVTPSGCRYRATSFEWSPFEFLPSPHAARHVQQVAHEWLGMAWYRLTGKA